MTNDHPYHPQQSVLKPHAEQRQTACMRYISAPQRSQRTFSESHDGLGFGVEGGTGSGSAGGRESDIAGIIAYTYGACRTVWNYYNL
jgi:hypothetical protein